MSKLMLVDDEVVITTQLEEILTSMGYEVLGTAVSGEEAVKMAKDLRPDLILMDIVMPGKMDGIAAAEKIRAELDISIIFITAHTDKDLVNRAKHTEPDGYVLKPFQEEQIRAAIEIALYKRDMEKKLQRSYDELETRVEERTAELLVANKNLMREIEDRSRAEQKLIKREEDLEIKTINLEEANIALKVLLKRRDEDKIELEEKVLLNVKELVVPYLGKLEISGLSDNQRAYLSILESNLNDIISPFLRQLSSEYHNFTPKEIQVAGLVKEGRTSKEIASLLNSTTEAVEFHRKNLRTKLGLKNKKANLRSHLLSLK